MTAKEFVDGLWSVYDEHQQTGITRCEIEDKLKYVLSNIPADGHILRNQTAKILHAYIRDVLEIPDITDEKVLHKATELRDLYDCRTCAYDIMQVYLRGIMEARYVIQENGMKLFGGGERLTNFELYMIRERLVASEKKKGTSVGTYLQNYVHLFDYVSVIVAFLVIKH